MTLSEDTAAAPSAPAEHRLHPLSILFSLAEQVQIFALPGVALLVTAGSVGWGWELWMLPALVPSALVSLSRYLTLRYRFEAHELVIRSGLLFRNERHVPYDRVQNLDAVQNVFHRLLEVVEVRVETGGGQEPEAKMSVLSLAAFEEMRGRVLGERAAAPPRSPGRPARRGRRRLPGRPVAGCRAGRRRDHPARAAAARAAALRPDRRPRRRGRRRRPSACSGSSG